MIKWSDEITRLFYTQDTFDSDAERTSNTKIVGNVAP